MEYYSDFLFFQRTIFFHQRTILLKVLKRTISFFVVCITAFHYKEDFVQQKFPVAVKGSLLKHIVWQTCKQLSLTTYFINITCILHGVGNKNRHTQNTLGKFSHLFTKPFTLYNFHTMSTFMHVFVTSHVVSYQGDTWVIH